MPVPQHCTLCPRRCGANRAAGPGACGGGSLPTVALAAPHHWEEPCISGAKGSGAVFFGGCPLGCVFCQNHAISHGAAGRPHTVAQLANAFLSLQHQGVHNLNLVSAGHWLPWVVQALALAKQQGLALPVVWNSGGYETAEAMEQLRPLVDVWLLDVKFHSPALAQALANAPDYFEVAGAAAQAACAMAGPPVLDENGLLQKGVVLRLLVLPGEKDDAMALLRWMADSLPQNGFLLSLMCQYTPPEGVPLPKNLRRRLSSYEYRAVVAAAEALGLTNGYTQSRAAASNTFLPPFQL